MLNIRIIYCLLTTSLWRKALSPFYNLKMKAQVSGTPVLNYVMPHAKSQYPSENICVSFILSYLHHMHYGSFREIRQVWKMF